MQLLIRYKCAPNTCFQITEDHKSPKFDPSPALAHRDTSRLLVVSYDHVIHWQSRDLSDAPKLYSVWLDRKQKEDNFSCYDWLIDGWA
ncbi:hypothetical protein CEXT_767751 [Caerostris extrusa]|uniref:Uncharacterized protein n=1 Tax=Caerostris extrusa TaxID=172846 RepID=A0AAV4TBF3_CAEEX|nr:hypothetical protein CEXT_767751 [Caerostris extrusa]